jgi:hypothetical protein
MPYEWTKLLYQMLDKMIMYDITNIGVFTNIPYVFDFPSTYKLWTPPEQEIFTEQWERDKHMLNTLGMSNPEPQHKKLKLEVYFAFYNL